MSLHTAVVEWGRAGKIFRDNRYSREHVWRFDGGIVVKASSSPHSVKVPFSNPANVDPEEAFVAALSSCHMLWFLSLAAAAGFVVDTYVDEPEGVLENDLDGKKAITTLVFKPAITFSGVLEPTEAAVSGLHHQAHEACFLANSVRTKIAIEGTWRFIGASTTKTAAM